MHRDVDAGGGALPSVKSPWGSQVHSTSPDRKDQSLLRHPPKTSLGFHVDEALLRLSEGHSPSRRRSSLVGRAPREGRPRTTQLTVSIERSRPHSGFGRKRNLLQGQTLGPIGFKTKLGAIPSEKPVLDLARQIESRLRTEIQDAKRLLLQERERGMTIERKIKQILPLANRAQELLGFLTGPEHGMPKKTESMVISEEAEAESEEDTRQEQQAAGVLQECESKDIVGESTGATGESRSKESIVPSGTENAVVDGSEESNTGKSHRQSQSNQSATRGESTADAGNARRSPVKAQSYAALTALGQKRLMQGIHASSPPRRTHSRTRDSEEGLAADRGAKEGGIESLGQRSMSEAHSGRAEGDQGKISTWSSEGATWRLAERWSKGTAWWEHARGTAAASHVEGSCDVSPGLLLQVQEKIAHSLAQLEDAAAEADRNVAERSQGSNLYNADGGQKPDDGGEHKQAVSDMVKLDVYMEGFEELLSGFKAYRPLLARIKQAMDLCVRDYREALEAASGNKIAALARKKAELELLKKTTFETTNSLNEDRSSLSERVGEGEAKIQRLEDRNAHQRLMANTRSIQSVRTEKTAFKAMHTNDELFIQRKELTDIRSASELTHFKVRRCEKKIARMRSTVEELQGEQEMMSALLGKMTSENEEHRLNADIQCANLTHLDVTVDDLLWAWRESRHRGSFERLWEQAQAQSRRRQQQKSPIRAAKQGPTPEKENKRSSLKAPTSQMRQREIRAEQKAESQMTGMGRAALLGADDFLQAPGGVLDLVESDEPEGGGQYRDRLGSMMLVPCAMCGEAVQQDEETVRQGPGRYIHRHCADKTFSSLKSQSLKGSLRSTANGNLNLE